MADEPAPAPAPTPPPKLKSRKRGIVVAAIVVGAILIAAGSVVAYAYASVDRWTVVDTPAQEETWTQVEVGTGAYAVWVDDDHLCKKNQPWLKCIKLRQAQYDANCADRRLSWDGRDACEDYKREIDRMRKVKNGKNLIVAKVGSRGYLSSVELYRSEVALPNAEVQAITHEAVCYLGFIGECTLQPEPPTVGLTSVETGEYMVIADGDDYCWGYEDPDECVAQMQKEFDETCGAVAEDVLTNASRTTCKAFAALLETVWPNDNYIRPSNALGHLFLKPIVALEEVEVQGQFWIERDLTRAMETAETAELREAFLAALADRQSHEDAVTEVEDLEGYADFEDAIGCVLRGFAAELSDRDIVRQCAVEQLSLPAGD